MTGPTPPADASAGPAVSGVLVVDKPAGWTSHDVVGRVRRLVGTRRVGHAGTLDPMATGVLVLGVGRGTRLLRFLAPTRKAYLATARLGVVTSTDDAEGEVVRTAATGHLDAAAVRAAAARLVGAIDQVPSAVSAVKVAGERAYALVRRGEQPALSARRVTVYELRVEDVRIGAEKVDLDLVVECSSGTYVRALVRDLGATLGVGGHVTSLRRTSVGQFTLASAQSLDEMGEHGVRMLTLAEAASLVLPTVECDDDEARAVSYGQRVPLAADGADGPVALVGTDGRLLAVYLREGDVARPVTVFEPA